MEQRTRMLCQHADAVVRFLNEIGLPVLRSDGAKGFIAHIRVEDGRLLADPAAPASGLLHEAGHLAIVPTRFRHYLSGNLSNGFARIFSELDLSAEDPESPLSRAMLQAGDTEATAWAWAAGKAIGIPDELIIQDHEYDGEGAAIRLGLSMGHYIGINGLSRAGFCSVRPNRSTLFPVYPKLTHWLHP